MINGVHVDWILRDCARVKRILASRDRTIFRPLSNRASVFGRHVPQELAYCKILYAADEEFAATKRQAERYPAALKRALADFKRAFPLKAVLRAGGKERVQRGYFLRDRPRLSACSALNQVLFALNEQWCLNEKKAVFRIDGLPIAPENYSQTIAAIFRQIALSPEQGRTTPARPVRGVAALRAGHK